MAPAGRSSQRSGAGDKKRGRNNAQSTHLAAGHSQRNFSAAEVLHAVSSLYDDQLRPNKWMLRKRLAEQVETVSTWPKEHDSEGLRLLCQTIQDLHVQPEEGGEWYALLVNRAPDFVDIYDEKDPYPEDMWTAAHAYFLSLGRNGIPALPRGRYASAQVLAARRLPFLAGFTLGQVCHIVQLAVSHRRLLGYTNSNVVAFEHSVCASKLQCIQQQQQQHLEGAASTSISKNLTVADWCIARTILREILEWAVLRGNESVQLANVKRLFRSVYAVDLNETALGHCKLSELLRDDQFKDICEVKLRGHGYVVVPVQLEAMNHEQGSAPPLPNDSNSHTNCGTNEAAGLSCSSSAEIAPPVHHTFIHFRLPPTTPPTPAVYRRSRSVPGDQKLLVPRSTDGCSQGTQFPSHGAVPLAQQKERQRTENEVVNGKGLTSSVFVPSAAAATENAQHCQGDVGGDHVVAWKAMCHVLGMAPIAPMTPVVPMTQECNIEVENRTFLSDTRCLQETGDDRMQFCRDEPLHLDEADCAGNNIELAPRFFPMATPSPVYEAVRASDEWRHTRSIKKEEDSFQFCQDEPLCLEDAMACDGSDQQVPWASTAPCFAQTPSPRYTCPSSPWDRHDGCYPRTPSPRYASPRSPWERHIGSNNAAGSLEGGSCELAQGTLSSPSWRSTSAGSRAPSVTSEEVSSNAVAGFLPQVAGAAAAALVCDVEPDACLVAGIWEPNACCNTHPLQPQLVATSHSLAHGAVGPAVPTMILATTVMATDNCHRSLERVGTNMLPPPPMHPPVLTSQLQQHAAPPSPVAPNTEALIKESSGQESCVLRLSDLVQNPGPGGSKAEVSSLGSQQHPSGKCRPCAHFHTRSGCRSGASCNFCHRCTAGELKRRQRVKRTATQQCLEDQQQRLQQRLEEQF